MNERITLSNITELKENEIFVFGSNSNGVHNGNAAATAMKFGAIMGQAAGIQGQTYAMPSKHIENLKKHIDDFLLYAEQHSEYTFLVTEIGCGISKHSPFEIAPLFKEAVHIKNINLPLSFWDVLNGGIQARIKQVAEKESPSVPDFCQRTGLSFTITDEHFIQKRTSYRLDCAKDTDCLPVYQCKVATFRRRRYETHETQ